MQRTDNCYYGKEEGRMGPSIVLMHSKDVTTLHKHGPKNFLVVEYFSRI